MKKILTSLSILCLSYLSVAQVNVYQYQSGTLTEQTIANMLEAADNDGLDAEGLDKLDKILHKRMRDQQDMLSGKISQKGIPPVVNSTGCVNPGFENGTNSDWNFYNGSNSGYSLPCNTCPSSPGGINTIVTSSTTVTGQCTNGIDDYGNFPVVAPAPNPGGNYALLLNDASAGYKMQKATYSYVVGSSNDIFTFQYAAVLQSPGSSHTSPSQAPYFHVDVTDNTTGSAISCTEYEQYVPSSGSLNGWSVSSADPSVYYKPWTTVSVDLSAAVGHTVTLSYVVSDCNQGGHFGYAYIDGDCGNISVTNVAGICNGNNANLCGPPGYASYSWTGPATGSSQCLSTSAAGTYTLNMTSALTCPAPILTYTVTASALPTANYSYSVAPCSLTANFTDASSVPSPNTITDWEWDFGDGQSATSTTAGNTQSHTYASNGSYTAVLTCTTSAGCVGTYSTTVNISSSLSAPATSSSVTCSGASTGSATTTPSGGSGTYTYSWAPSGGTNSIATGLAAGVYSVSVNDGAGCSTITTVTVNSATPITSTSSIVQSSCGQYNGSATISVSGGTGPYTYTWTAPGGNSSTISGVNANTYTCNITDANGCPYATSVNITDLPGPAITAISSGSVSCYGGTNGTAVVTATGSGIGYSWSPSGGSSSTASGLNAGTYTVTVTDVNSCTTSSVVTVSEPTDIVPTSSVTASLCGGATGSATVIPSGGTGSYTFNWSPSGGNASIASNLASGSYNCTIKDGNNCTKVVSVFITTTSGPTVTATSASVTCNGASTGSASVSASGTGPMTYTWSSTPVQTTQNATGLPAGTYTCLVQDGAGCFSSATTVISQPSAITNIVTPTNIKCNGASTGVITVNTSGGTGPYSYTWSPSGGNSGTASGLQAGTYSVAILDAQNCPSFTMATLTQPTALSATATTTSVSCVSNASTTYTVNGTAAVTPAGGVGPYTYNWSPSGGSSSSAIHLAGGTYITTITDANNCTYTVSSTVAAPPAVTGTVSSTNISCNGFHDGTATVTANGGSGTYTYQWTPGGGTGTTVSNMNTGTFTCTIKDANNCSLKVTTAITQPTKVTINVTGSPVKCAGATNGSAVATVSGGVPTYTVTWNSTPAQTGLTATGLAAGSYTAVATDSKGCQSPKKVTITTPEPKDTLDMTGTLCSTDPAVTLSAPSGTGISSPYQWYNSSGPISGATATTYSAQQAQIHDYFVTWYHNGCLYSTSTVDETIIKDISSIPQTNVFTPNADKINDEFYPLALNINAVSSSSANTIKNLLKEYELFVYDRWGILMYTSTDFTKPWDGKNVGGKEAPDGTYYWVMNYKTTCNFNSGRQKLKGFVQLIK